MVWFEIAILSTNEFLVLYADDVLTGSARSVTALQKLLLAFRNLSQRIWLLTRAVKLTP